MGLAVSAGAGSPESLAYVESLLGKLEIDRGNYGAAEHAYREALAADPGFPAARSGTGAGRGRAGHARRRRSTRYRSVVERLPLPEYVIGLGEAEIAAGRRAAAERDLALVGVEAKLLRSAGVNVDVELALYEADHGDRGPRRRARPWRLAAGARAFAPPTPTPGRLHSAGRERPRPRMSAAAMRLGSRDPVLPLPRGDDRGERRRPRPRPRTARRTGRADPRLQPALRPRARRASWRALR